MTINQTPASTSDARKRLAEKEQVQMDNCRFVPSDQPPVLPDTTGWVKREPGDVIEAGTPCLWRDKEGLVGYEPADDDFVVAAPESYWTPPPVVPVSPVDAIPVGRENAKPLEINGVIGTYWRNENVEGLPQQVFILAPNSVADSKFVGYVDTVTSVVPLRVIPDDHVAVPREQIDDLVRWWAGDGGRGRLGREIFPELAALLDGEVTR